MSSLRNSLHRRNHKERSQLSHRTRLGFLEKHKDYVLRARDYHSKKDRIQRLRQKAADRNKDEFYFGMNKQKTKGGVHIQDRGNTALPVDVVKVLKTQDENYIRTMRHAGLKKIDRIKEQLTPLADLVRPTTLDSDILMDEGNELDEQEVQVLQQAGVLQKPSSKSKSKTSARSASKHVVFADDLDAAQRLTRKRKPAAASSDTAHSSSLASTVDLGWKDVVPVSKRKGKAKAVDDAGNVDTNAAEKSGTESKEHRGRLLKELAARLKRDVQLKYAGRELEMQRLLMEKGARRKLRGVEKAEGEDDDGDDSDEDSVHRRRARADPQAYKPRVYKWRMERKK